MVPSSLSGNRIVYGDINGYTYYADWNGSNYNIGMQINDLQLF
jgi:hypothetical protein